MSRARQLYRSRNALVGGVCAGIAERFDVDPLVVRILFLTFAVLTLGLAGLAYLVLWAVLPKRPMQVKPVKVEPDSVHSDTFGAVDCRRARGAAMGRCSNTVPYVSAAHLPPVPPAMAEKVRCDQAPAMGLDAASVGPRDVKAGEGDGPSTARIVLAGRIVCGIGVFARRGLVAMLAVGLDRLRHRAHSRAGGRRRTGPGVFLGRFRVCGGVDVAAYEHGVRLVDHVVEDVRVFVAPSRVGGGFAGCGGLCPSACRYRGGRSARAAVLRARFRLAFRARSAARVIFWHAAGTRVSFSLAPRLAEPIGLHNGHARRAWPFPFHKAPLVGCGTLVRVFVLPKLWETTWGNINVLLVNRTNDEGRLHMILSVSGLPVK